MVPKRPPKSGKLGFLYLPPWRIQGISTAGEQTAVQVPELDVTFDIGLCPRPVLAAPFVALSHGHMDHVAGLPYYFSQRMFQKMPVGTCICHRDLVDPIHEMMRGWVRLEHQQTPYEVVGLAPNGEVDIKPNIRLRAIESSHTVPAMSYVAMEYRSKLLPEFQGLPQNQIRELRRGGTTITQVLEIPLVACTGDTEMGSHLERPEFRDAEVVITECTFFSDTHRDRARIGKHLHLSDLARLLECWTAKHVVVVHTSRRTHIHEARSALEAQLGPEQSSRVHFLMDHRANSLRYARQCEEAEASLPVDG